MLKFIFSSFLIISVLCINAQDYSRLKEINLEDSTTCRNNLPKILEVCDYLLQNPCIETKNSVEIGYFVTDWMNFNPDYRCGANENIYYAVQKSNALITIYYCCIAKAHIDNNVYYDNVEVQLVALKTLLKYVENPDNQVKINGKLKNFIKARKTGDLRGAL